MKLRDLNPINAYRVTPAEAEAHRRAPYAEIPLPLAWPMTLRELLALLGGGILVFLVSVLVVAPLAGGLAGFIAYLVVGGGLAAWIKPAPRVVEERREAMRAAEADRG